MILPRFGKYGAWAAALVVLFGALGFLALPPLVKRLAVDTLGEALHRPVSIRNVAVNPFALSLTVEGLEIGEREGGEAVFAGFESLYLDLQASSFFRWAPVIQEVRLDGPKIRLVRTGENRYNFSDLLDEFMARPQAEGREDAPPAFSLDDLHVSGGRVEFDDRVLGKTHVVSEIALDLPFVSSLAHATDIFVEPRFSANVDGAPLKVEGRSKPFAQSRGGEFRLTLDKVSLPESFDYFPLRIPVKLKSGVLNADIVLVYRLDGKVEASVSGKATVKDFAALEASGAPLLAFRRLDIDLAAADLTGGGFAVERVAVDSPDISVRASAAGTINWLELFSKAAEAGRSAASAKPFAWSLGEARLAGGVLRWADDSRATPFRAEARQIDARIGNLDGQGSEAEFEAALKLDAGSLLTLDALSVKGGRLDMARHRVRLGEVRLAGGRAALKRSADGSLAWIDPPALRAARQAKESEAAPWTAQVGQLVGEGLGLRFVDASVSPEAVQNVEGLGFAWTSAPDGPGQAANVRAAFKLNRRGEAALDGTLNLAPLEADLGLELKSVEILPLQPYFSGKLDVAVKSGHLSGGGKIRLRSGGGKGGALSGGFTGQLAVGDFQAIDKAASADLLRWKSLRLAGIDARFGPESVAINEAALSDFFARLIVSPQGKLNLFNLVRKDEAAQAPPPAADSPEGRASAPVAVRSAPPLPVKIGRIALRGGSVRFTDNFIKPNYSANLSDIAGQVADLSSDPGTQARLELRGRYDKIAPLGVSARINPLSEKPYLDLQADVKGIDLTTLSAYSGKYAGYAIDKGKLSLTVKYQIENSQLEAENRVFLDQLSFGEAVDSPEATTLPVRLAVTLLKNRDGEIDVNLPISGSLDDPQFSVGGLIVKVLVNLITKAVTSPFALIGSMFGSSEELSNVDFDPGSAALAPKAVGRLETLAKALADKPELKFEIEGRADPARDADGLKRARLDRRIRTLKREEAAKEEEAPDDAPPASAVTVTPQEYPELLERIYKAENFPKPRNMIGFVQSQPVAEMERLIFEHSSVGEADLKNLADRRAKAVRDWLAAHGVAAERIFLLPGKVAAAEEEEASGSRANFSIK